MKGKARILAVAAGLFAVSIFAGGIRVTAASETDTIKQGVFIGDVDVSGMTAEEAKAAVNQKIKDSQGEGFTVKVGDHELTATAEDFGLQWKNTEVVEEALELGKAGNIIKRYKETKDLENQTRTFDITYEPDEAAVEEFVSQAALEYDSEATEGSLSRDEYGNFIITGGEEGIVINQEKSVETILNYLEVSGGASEGAIQLVAEIDTPNVTAEELSKVTDLLGTATTTYGSTYGRNTNVEVGASKLNGILLMPGETFSVTAAVIPFTAENGYELAPSYESGQVVDSYGGGICQVSTTLYNAVLKAELEVLERHNHTMIVTYVDPSKDAAIAEGLMDLQFMNNTEAPIYIEGGAWGGVLTFNIYGQETRPADRYIEFISETLSTTAAEGVKLVAKYDQNVGYLTQVQSPMDGLHAVLWKRVTYNGETTTEQVNSSTYQATPAIYEVGVNSADPNVTAAMVNAIATGSLEAVQNVINNGTGTAQTEPATEATEPATETPQTDPIVEEPTTEAPAAQTDPVAEEPTTEAPAADPGQGEVIEEFF
ncbi:MAG: VanW family protein [Eubacteriales bacterium]|nr:VanW family protein [Eubacteriales bacterium]